MKQILFLLFTFLFSQFGFSQTLLKGKVVSDASNQGEIYVTNLSIDVKTITDSNGLFSILAKPNHVLVFSGTKTERKSLVLQQSDFLNDFVGDQSLFFPFLSTCLTRA